VPGPGRRTVWRILSWLILLWAALSVSEPPADNGCDGAGLPPVDDTEWARPGHGGDPFEGVGCD